MEEKRNWRALTVGLERLRRAARLLWERVASVPLRYRVAFVAVVAVLIGGLLAVQPLVISKAEQRAERLGLELDVAGVQLGLGRVWLTGVSIRAPELPALEVRLERVGVQVTPSLAVKAVVVEGGEVKLHGTPERLKEQVERWRSKRPRGSGGGGEGASYTVQGLDIDWREAGGPFESLRAKKVSYSRSGGAEHIGLDHAQVGAGGDTAELADLRLVIERNGSTRRVQRLSASSLVAKVDLDAVKKPGSGARAPAGVSKTVPAAVAQPSPAQRLGAAVTRLGELAKRHFSEAGEVELDGLRLKLRHNGETLNIGPAQFRAEQSRERLKLSLTPGSQAAESLALVAELPLEHGEALLELNGGPVSLASLGIGEGEWGLQGVARTQLSGKGLLRLSADRQVVRFTGASRIRELSVKHRALAQAPVTGIELAWRGSGELRLDGSYFRLQDAELELGKLKLLVSGELEQAPDYIRTSVRASVPLLACQDWIDSLPQGLIPLLAGMHATGTFGMTGELELDTREVDRTRLDWELRNDCRVTDVPPSADPQRFSRPWVREVKGADGRMVQIESGPGTESWVPYDRISRHMETAVLVCEDGRFFRHGGFDPDAIRSALKDNLRAGRFVRGASTISMQLAKNLYLGRQKTLDRKLQEAVLTYLLEQELSKEQMMELYLNVIEFGPGIYGIGPAAQHYFKTIPSQLSLGQALYLASILPNPKPRYLDAEGQVNETWTAYLRKLMYIAHKIKRIDDQELAEGLLEQVTFGVPYSPRVENADAAAAAGDGAAFGPIPPMPPEPGYE